jgi:adenosylcobyric acid synthase
MTQAVMVQGTGSNVGKSVLVAGLCRAYLRRGLKVRPFKPQNMSNNAAVTADGGEIGRAQALQAMASGIDPVVDLNPVLLKPETDKGAQVVLRGQRLTTVKARDYAALKPKLLDGVLEAWRATCVQADLVLVEGAGSPAEINLRKGDIANMGFAEAAGVPVVLAGDIDRGGVIAQIVGTHAVLPEADRTRIKAFLVNKFRGDPRLFDDGYAEIEARTGWPGLGTLPWFAEASHLPAEDAADIRSNTRGGAIKIVCPLLSRIANFDDLDPLKQAPGVSVEMIPAGHPLPGDANVVILPGSKSTRGDLAFFRAQGWDIDLAAHVRRGGHVFGLCGGYQMLGRTIADPDGIEGEPGTSPGLGLLDIKTVMTPEKTLTRSTGRDLATGQPISGYEIHIGRSEGPDCARPVLEVEGRPHGARSEDGRIAGVYMHGLFTEDAFRTAWLASLGAVDADFTYGARIESILDRLADHLEAHLDLDRLRDIARGDLGRVDLARTR